MDVGNISNGASSKEIVIANYRCHDGNFSQVIILQNGKVCSSKSASLDYRQSQLIALVTFNLDGCFIDSAAAGLAGFMECASALGILVGFVFFAVESVL